MGAALAVLIAGAAYYATLAPSSTSSQQCSGTGSVTFTSSTIKIGYVTELSGVGESNGYAARIGAEMAVNETNSSGGVNGKNVSLDFQNDFTNPQIATQMASTLDNQGVLAITGPNDANDASAVSRYAESCGVPFMASTVQSAMLVSPKSNWTASLAPDPVQMGAAVAKYVSQAIPNAKIALMTQSGVTQGEMSAGVRWFANTYGNESVVFDQVFSNPQFPWATPAAAAKFSGANAVVVSWLSTVGFSQSNVISALISAGFSQSQIFVVLATDQIGDMGTNATGIRGATLFDGALAQGNANISAFVSKVEPYIKGQSNPYIAYCGVCPTEIGSNYYYAYLGMKLMINAVKASLSNGQALTRASYMSSLKQTTIQDFTGSALKVDYNASGSGKYYLVGIEQPNADTSSYLLNLISTTRFAPGVVPSYSLSQGA